MDRSHLFSQLNDREEIIERVSLYVKVRWLVISILAFGGFLTYLPYPGTEILELKLIVLTGAAFIANAVIFVLIWLGKQRRFKENYFVILSLLQLVCEIALYSLSIFFLGDSAYRVILLFALPIVMSGALFSRAYIYFTASVCFLFFTSATVLGSLNQYSRLPDQSQFFSTLFFGGIFFILAYMCDYLFAIRRKREVELAQTEMVSLASHQLRTPATAVKGFLSFILDGDLGTLKPKQKDFIRQAYEENEIQLRLIDNILNVARLELKSLHFEPRKIDIKTLVSAVIEEHAHKIRKKQQDIIFEPKEDDYFINADPQLMRMCIDNLISNASKFTNKGGRIIVKIRKESKEIKISIEDNGLGISKQDQRLLFRRFSRAKDRRGESVEGSGLGLYLARQLIKMHHGNISLTSYPGEGSIFTITIPRK